MKLIRCHIENFGVLHSCDIDFKGGISAFYSPNGGGKSTLAAFIKAMFYGLPADSSRARFNERRHYYPFAGGKFGGNLTFEWRGRLWRAERFFDRTSGDEFRLYRDGELCRDCSAGLGQAVFGMDEQSFARTLYFAGDGGELSPTGDINARLGDYLSAGESADGALQALEKACKRLQSRGNRGRIPELEGLAARCRADIAAADEASARLDGKYAERAALAAELAAVRREAESVRRAAAADGARLRADEARARLAALEERYPEGMPDEREVSVLEKAAGARAQAGARARRNRPGAATVLSFLLSALLVAGGVAVTGANLFVGIAAVAAGALFAAATLCVLFFGRARRFSGGKDIFAAADGVLERHGLGGADYGRAAAILARDVAERDGLVRMSEAGVAAGRDGKEEADAGETARREEELLRRLAAADRDISDDESIVEGAGERRAALAAVTEELAECRTKLEDYSAAARLLKEAERSLRAGAAQPVGQSFARYCSLMRSALGDSVYVDKDLSVALEGSGELRSVAHLSAGQRALVSLCYRLALCDHLFGEDLPFIVLDDPFRELDEERMSRAAALLGGLAKDRQIIYFYCHKSRAVG